MITLHRQAEWYRPYVYGKYTIKEIVFYNENGIVVKNEHGWLEHNKCADIMEDLKYLSLSIEDIPIKRKEDFNCKGAFLISKGKNYDEYEATLYIKDSLLDLQFNGYIIRFFSVYEWYKGQDFNGHEFDVFKHVKSLEDKLWTYRSKIEAAINDLSLLPYEKKQFEDNIKQLKKYGKLYYEEQEKINNYTTEDYLKEINHD